MRDRGGKAHKTRLSRRSHGYDVGFPLSNASSRHSGNSFDAPLVSAFAASGATVVSDRFAGYRKLAEHRTHVGKIVGNMAAHVLLPWIHRTFSNLKRWFIGTLHGVRKQHLKRYLDEFTFRWNRRRHAGLAFDRLLGLATQLGHASYRHFVEQAV